MNTEDLIKSMSADVADREMPMGRAWLLAALAAFGLAATVFFILIGPRADIGAAMQTWRFPFKFVVTLTLAFTAWKAVASLSHPDAGRWRALRWLLAAPALIVAAIAVEVLTIPMDQMMPRLVGTNNMLCLVAIPAIGALPLAGFLAVLRHGAPASPGLAGAVAGVFAAAVAATFYAAHCIDDSPLFVALWYSLATLILALVGYAAGRSVARW